MDGRTTSAFALRDDGVTGPPGALKAAGSRSSHRATCKRWPGHTATRHHRFERALPGRRPSAWRDRPRQGLQREEEKNRAINHLPPKAAAIRSVRETGPIDTAETPPASASFANSSSHRQEKKTHKKAERFGEKTYSSIAHRSDSLQFSVKMK